MSGGLARRLAILVAVVVAVLVAGAVVWLDQAMHRPYAGWSGETAVVLIEPGLDAGSMLDLLHASGVVRYPRVVRGWLLFQGGAESLRAGEYRFDAPSSATEVLARLRDGDVILHAVTIPEGLNLTETAQRLADAGFGTAEELSATFRDPTPLVEIDPVATDLEGYLFPETYRFPRGSGPREVTSALLGQFRRATESGYRARAADLGLTLREAVTLASLIEKETSVPEERRRIARVFHNRLERGMKLECDPTVRYAIEREGREVERLTYDDLRFDSPWNTYRVHGLPPGPIASPGLASLQAAVTPDSGDDLYFVAAPGGGHRFSKDLQSHLSAVAEWRRYVRSSR